MSHYRRYFVPGGTYFFTLVTERRMPLFADSAARSLLGNVMRDCFAWYPLRVVAIGGREQPRSTSRLQQRRRGVWQRRFWEHTIEDEIDLESHCDYLHFNPVKHGYVMQVCDWPWSTFHRWVQLGHYDRKWGSGFRPRELPGMAGE